MVMPDCKVNLACVNRICVVLGGPGGCLVIKLDCREYMASVKAIYGSLVGYAC